jgi:HAD superfamily hydrolase (TIGR01509 family)
MSTIKYIFWDFDNTLFLTAEHHWMKNKVVLEQHGIDLPEEHKHRVFLLGSDQNWEWFRDELGFALPKIEYKEKVDTWFANNLPNVQMREGTLEALDFFKQKDMPQVVVTNGRTNSVVPTLTVHDKLAYFDAVLCKEDYEGRKPLPAPYLAGIKALEERRNITIDPSECLAIEDEEKGVASAEAAGMQVLFRPLGDDTPLMPLIQEKLR